MSNLLEREASLYLQQHSNNLVNWYSWGDKALKKAKNENKSIFLSIGYSSSLWCKRMAEESFQNKKVAELLNERFISIKVDRDEYPNIAKFYQKVYKLMNRSNGAFPLSIFMTEDLKPFYADSYISPEAQEEKLGFEELLRVISKKYITDYETLVTKGDEVLQYINPKDKKIEATKLNIDILNTITLHSNNLIDKENGGFGTSAKFPNSSTLMLMLESYQLNQEESILQNSLFSLDKMREKELYDHTNGGFYSYTKEKNWKIPHRVKTIFDNVLLTQLYTQAYQITSKVEYKETAVDTLEFILKEMSENHLFYSRIDETESKEIDKTVVTSWNAMMIKTLFKATSIDKKYQKIAIESLSTLLKTLYINNTLYHTNSLKTEAFLEDYAYMGEMLIEAYQSTLDESYLIMATDFSNKLIEKFYNYGQWNFSNEPFKIEADVYDTDYPSSLSTAISLLMSISSLVDTNYKKFVFKTLEINSYNLMRQPLSSPKLTTMLLRYLKDDIIIKSNEEILSHIVDKKDLLGYPYLLLKTTLDKNILLCNSNSCFASTDKSDELKPLIERYI